MKSTYNNTNGSPYIKAPYNFVPINKQVVSPHWANWVNHDIPFQGGESGSLEITIDAKSPIFIRNGASKDDSKKAKKAKAKALELKSQLEEYHKSKKDEKIDIEQLKKDIAKFEKEAKEYLHKSHKFSNFNGKFFIPGSSLKGMIRNVMEIMSFGRMVANNHRYAVRDLSNKDEDFYRKHFKPKTVFCGYLRKDKNEKYTITDHGHPKRISHKKLDNELGSDFSEFFGGRGFNQKKDEQKSAKFKYDKFEGENISRHHSFRHIKTDNGGRAIYDFGGKEKGTIIFTGQPGPRKLKNNKWTGKHLEFIFLDKSNPQTFPVSPETISDFKFAYFDHDKNQQSIDWKMWSKKLNNEESIPVFFMKGRDSNGKEIVAHLGLSYLYKLPYKNSVKEAIEKFQGKSSAPDLASTIFGYISGNENSNDELDFLKGRVHISHAFEEEGKKVKIGSLKAEVLSSPKASYYPNYIRQKVKNGKIEGKYRTFKNTNVEISGWKRYPIQTGKVSENPSPINSDSSSNEDILTRFIPLEKAQFKCKIQYHNLRKIELGALISALTFHNTSGTFHNIGMAKSLGYGKIDVQVEGIEQLKPFLKEYELYMNAALGYKDAMWHKSPQIRELLTMAQEQGNINKSSSELSYMKLGVGSGKNANHFIKAITNKEALGLYSTLENINSFHVQLNPSITPNEIEKMAEWIEQEKESQRKRKSIDELKDERIRQAEIKISRKMSDFQGEMLEKLRELREQKRVQEEEDRKVKEKAEIDKNKALKKDKALAKGLVLEDIDTNHRNAFKDTEKATRIFCEHLLGSSNVRKMEKNIPPEGILPREYHDVFKNKISSIYPNLSPKDKKNWLNPKKYYKKIVDKWLGVNTTDEFWKEFK